MSEAGALTTRSSSDDESVHGEFFHGCECVSEAVIYCEGNGSWSVQSVQ